MVVIGKIIKKNGMYVKYTYKLIQVYLLYSHFLNGFLLFFDRYCSSLNVRYKSSKSIHLVGNVCIEQPRGQRLKELVGNIKHSQGESKPRDMWRDQRIDSNQHFSRAVAVHADGEVVHSQRHRFGVRHGSVPAPVLVLDQGPVRQEVME